MSTDFNMLPSISGGFGPSGQKISGPSAPCGLLWHRRIADSWCPFKMMQEAKVHVAVQIDRNLQHGGLQGIAVTADWGLQHWGYWWIADVS